MYDILPFRGSQSADARWPCKSRCPPVCLTLIKTIDMRNKHPHWAEDILASPMPSSTQFGIEGRYVFLQPTEINPSTLTYTDPPRSESYGPFRAWDELNIQAYSQLLFRK